MRMSEQRELVEGQHKDGPSWDTVRVFSSFDEADRFRKSVLTSSKQVKVKKQLNTTGQEIFVVKSRNNPSLQSQPQVEDVPVKKIKKSKSNL
jgi:hypothetical protein